MSLWKELPAALREDICGYRKNSGNGRKRRRSDSDEDVTEHRAYKSITRASRPRLCPAIERYLVRWYKEPQTIFEQGRDISPSNPIDCYFNVIYSLHESRSVDSVRWKLCLIPLSRLKRRFQSQRISSNKLDDLATVAIQSGLLVHNKEEIRKSLPSLLTISNRYERLATSAGGEGTLCCLPEDVPYLT